MGRIDKTEDKVNKVFREYQDNWSKYAELLEKDSTNVKVRERERGVCVWGEGWRLGVCLVFVCCVYVHEIIVISIPAY